MEKPMNEIWSDEEWDARQEAEEARIKVLSDSLRPCPRHGVKASIQEENGSMIILSTECDCWYGVAEFDSIEQAVTAWNEQPYIDTLRQRIAELERQLAEAQGSGPVVWERVPDGFYDVKGFGTRIERGLIRQGGIIGRIDVVALPDDWQLVRTLPAQGEGEE